MKKLKSVIVTLAIIGATLAIFFVLKDEKTLVTHPKGIIAHSELQLIKTNILLMLCIIVPTFLFLFTIVWRSRANKAKTKTQEELDRSPGVFSELILWILPIPVVIAMSIVTWNATHELDPYQPLKSDIPPLKIQVVALDWKWLFIYPEQGIASVNFIQIPERTPIHFELAADGSPMNSFWIPQLSGQIYSMTGMITQLHIMANEAGVYEGKAAEINGRGYAHMTFTVKSTSRSDFDNWVQDIQQSPLHLTAPVYKELVKPSEKHPITLYSHVENELFHEIVMKYMHPM